MRVISIIAVLFILLFGLTVMIYYGVEAFNGNNHMWCSGSGIKTYGCNTDFGMAATSFIFFVALIVGLIIRAMTNPKADNFKIEKEKESDD